MKRFILTILAITVTTSVSAGDLGDKIRAAVEENIATRLKERTGVTGPRAVNNILTGINNAGLATADVVIYYDAGDITYAPTTTHAPVTTTTTTTQAPPRKAPRQHPKKNKVRNAPLPQPPYYPPIRFVPPALTYGDVIDECRDVIHIRCWGAYGDYFEDAEGRRFTLLESYSKVPSDCRKKTLTGTYWRSSGGILFITARWDDGTTRVFFEKSY